MGFTCTFREADVFHHVTDIIRHRCGHVGYYEGYYEVQQSTHGAECFRCDSEEPVVRSIWQHVRTGNEEPAFVGEDVHQGGHQTNQHTGYCTCVVHLGAEDTHHQYREDGRCSQTEGQCYHLSRKAWRIQTQITRYQNGTCHCDTCSHQFLFLANIRHEGTLQQVMGNCGRDRQQQTRCCRQCRSQTTGSHQGDYPVWQVSDFRVSQYHDVTVNFHHLIAFPAERFSLRSKFRVGVIVILDTAVAILIFKLQQTCGFPVLEPVRTFCIDQVAFSRANRARLNGIGQVQTSHGTYSWCCCVQDRDEQQCPASRSTGIRYFRYSEETDDYVWQTGCTHHQRQCVHQHVERTTFLRGVLSKTQINQGLVEFHQQWRTVSSIRQEAQLWNRVTGQVQRNKYRRYGVGKDQYTVLSDLSVSYTLHTTQYGVEEYDTHTCIQAGRVVHIHKAGEGNTDTFHLTDYVSQRGNDQTDYCHNTRST